jgi:hypothetical protein
MKQKILSHFQDYLIQYISHQYQDLLCCNSSQYILSHVTFLMGNRAALSRKRYGVEKTVDTHKILINAIQFYVCLQEI